jgi:hypothetical protein
VPGPVELNIPKFAVQLFAVNAQRGGGIFEKAWAK